MRLSDQEIVDRTKHKRIEVEEAQTAMRLCFVLSTIS